MTTTVECQALFHQFIDFISQNKDFSVRETEKVTPTPDIDREVRRLQSALSKKNVAENRLKDKGL